MGKTRSFDGEKIRSLLKPPTGPPCPPAMLMCKRFGSMIVVGTRYAELSQPLHGGVIVEEGVIAEVVVRKMFRKGRHEVMKEVRRDLTDEYYSAKEEER